MASADLPMGLVASEAPLTFHPFPRLSAELRLKIWELLHTHDPVVTITTLHAGSLHYRDGSFIGRAVYCATPPPILLHVNRESREETLKVYTLWGSTTLCKKPVYINFALDILYVNYDLAQLLFKRIMYGSNACNDYESRKLFTETKRIIISPPQPTEIYSELYDLDAPFSFWHRKSGFSRWECLNANFKNVAIAYTPDKGGGELIPASEFDTSEECQHRAVSERVSERELCRSEITVKDRESIARQINAQRSVLRNPSAGIQQAYLRMRALREPHVEGTESINDSLQPIITSSPGVQGSTEPLSHVVSEIIYTHQPTSSEPKRHEGDVLWSCAVSVGQANSNPAAEGSWLRGKPTSGVIRRIKSCL